MPKSSTRKTIQRKPANRKPISLKLTDAQRIVLAAASRRADAATTLPEQMTEKAAQKLAGTLIEKGLVREVWARADMAVWRRNDGGRAIALIVTKFGREAIKRDEDRPKDDAVAVASAPSAIARAETSQIAASSLSERTVPRQGSKLAEVMALLGRKQGVGIQEMTSAPGWLPHTMRAALTGLRKRGYRLRPAARRQ
jgi:Protein of unknown function (DUF3489)